MQIPESPSNNDIRDALLQLGQEVKELRQEVKQLNQTFKRPQNSLRTNSTTSDRMIQAHIPHFEVSHSGINLASL